MTSKEIKHISKSSTIIVLILLSIIMILILLYLKLNNKELFATNIDNYFNRYFATLDLYKTIQEKITKEDTKINDLQRDIHTVLAGNILTPTKTDSTLTSEAPSLIINGKIKNDALDKCLDINNSGSGVIFNDCNNSSLNQFWSLNNQDYQLKSKVTNKCLISNQYNNLLLNNCEPPYLTTWTYNDNLLTSNFNDPSINKQKIKCLDKNITNIPILKSCNSENQENKLSLV